MNNHDRIVVLGLVGQFPFAGIAWQLIHHLVGFQRLGFDVYYIEETGAAPYDPREKSLVHTCTYSVRLIAETLRRIGMEEKWTYHDGLADQWYGLPKSHVQELFAGALCVVNLCGASNPKTLTFCPKGKFLYLETDPVLNQVRLANGDTTTCEILDAHDVHVTYGENLGEPDCPIPLPRFAWKKTRPPVVVDLWSQHDDPTCCYFTTVATWHNRGKDLVFRDEAYQWSKHSNFLALADLPRCTTQEVELAVEIDQPEELALFRESGWRLTNPLAVSHDVDNYQRYIERSRGEFTVAKEVVARTKSGWFSDRSVCYLAAGKPVVTQETGFSKYIPTGRGLFAFETKDEVLAAFDAINSDYATHARAARDIAEEYFAATKLLAKILEDIGLW